VLLLCATNILLHIDSKDLSDVLSFIFVLEHDFALLREPLDILEAVLAPEIWISR
jgi:hypothetical protein